MDCNEVSTWSDGKVTTKDGSVNICRKYYGVTKITFNLEKFCFLFFNSIKSSGGYRLVVTFSLSSVVLPSLQPRGTRGISLICVHLNPSAFWCCLSSYYELRSKVSCRSRGLLN